jgi:hypothetical protein
MKKQTRKIGRSTTTDDQGGRFIRSRSPARHSSSGLIFSDDKVKGMMDVHGGIRFHKIFEWMLPMFEGMSFYEFFWQGCATSCCTASKTKGGRHCTIILPMGRLFLLTTSHAF